MKVQLLYFDGCPHVAEARHVLRAALAACALPEVAVEELDVEAPTTPAELRDWGSPTILVNGADVAGEEAPSGRSCRLYAAGERAGVPPRALIERRLREAIES
jgi:hypothetical protein